jgi:hypothetical protein
VKLAGVDGVVTITITGEVLNAEEYVKYEKEKRKREKSKAERYYNKKPCRYAGLFVWVSVMVVVSSESRIVSGES